MIKEKSLQKKIDRLSSKVESLEKDNERLRNENARLKANEDLVKEKIADFNSILEQLNNAKKSYEESKREVSMIKKEYRDALKGILSSVRKGVK